MKSALELIAAGIISAAAIAGCSNQDSYASPREDWITARKRGNQAYNLYSSQPFYFNVGEYLLVLSFNQPLHDYKLPRKMHAPDNIWGYRRYFSYLRPDQNELSLYFGEFPEDISDIENRLQKYRQYQSFFDWMNKELLKYYDKKPLDDQ